MDYNTFIKKATNHFLEKGWSTIEGYTEKIDLTVGRDETTTLVTTKRMIAFLNGDTLSKDDIKKVLETVHKLRKKSATPPLFPSTNVLVFVFNKTNNDDWILEKAKKRDFFTTNYTVSWVVDLAQGILKKHKGLPIIQSGKSEIETVLSSNNG